MNGNIDPYLQIRVFISPFELNELKEGRSIESDLDKTNSYEDPKKVKRILKLHPSQEDIPSDRELKPFNQEKEYELYLSQRRILLIEKGSAVDGYAPRKWVRSSCISLEGVI